MGDNESLLNTLDDASGSLDLLFFWRLCVLVAGIRDELRQQGREDEYWGAWRRFWGDTQHLDPTASQSSYGTRRLS